MRLSDLFHFVLKNFDSWEALMANEMRYFRKCITKNGSEKNRTIWRTRATLLIHGRASSSNMARGKILTGWSASSNWWSKLWELDILLEFEDWIERELISPRLSAGYLASCSMESSSMLKISTMTFQIQRKRQQASSQLWLPLSVLFVLLSECTPFNDVPRQCEMCLAQMWEMLVITMAPGSVSLGHWNLLRNGVEWCNTIVLETQLTHST